MGGRVRACQATLNPTPTLAPVPYLTPSLPHPPTPHPLNPDKCCSRSLSYLLRAGVPRVGVSMLMRQPLAARLQQTRSVTRSVTRKRHVGSSSETR